jgi:hypothetical protein
MTSLFEFRAKKPELEVVEFVPTEEPTTIVAALEWTDEYRALFQAEGYEVKP